MFHRKQSRFLLPLLFLPIVARGAAPAPGERLLSNPTCQVQQSPSDPFGVPMFHPTRSGGEQWFLGADPENDPRFKPQDDITPNGDGSWKVLDTQVRLLVYTSDGYSSSGISTYDRDDLALQGYMQSPKDWRNVEMTGFFRLNTPNVANDNFDLYARGGRHNDTVPCEGSSYKAAFHYDGQARWSKESWHVSYKHSAFTPATTALQGRWVGFKAVMRNVTVNGQPAVKLESYVNENADGVTWCKVAEVVDSGSWGGTASTCGTSVNAMPITWGGPIATFRWDNATDVDFKWLSVREIDPLP